jgi:hypothetical protein
VLGVPVAEPLPVLREDLGLGQNSAQQARGNQLVDGSVEVLDAAIGN